MARCSPPATCVSISARTSAIEWMFDVVVVQGRRARAAPVSGELSTPTVRGNPDVVVDERGVSDEPGAATLHWSPRYLTVSSLKPDWVDSLQAVRSHNIAFTESQTVAIATIGELIREYGAPRYCKIDIEGLDLAVIRSLPMPLGIVSFEHLPLNSTLPRRRSLRSARWRLPLQLLHARIASVPGPGSGLGGRLAAGIARHRRPRLVMRRFCVQAGRAPIRGRSCVLPGQRQRDIECGATLGPALRPQPPTERGHECAADRKTHAQTALLAGVERLKQGLDVVR